MHKWARGAREVYIARLYQSDFRGHARAAVCTLFNTARNGSSAHPGACGESPRSATGQGVSRRVAAHAARRCHQGRRYPLQRRARGPPWGVLRRSSREAALGTSTCPHRAGTVADFVPFKACRLNAAPGRPPDGARTRWRKPAGIPSSSISAVPAFRPFVRCPLCIALCHAKEVSSSTCTEARRIRHAHRPARRRAPSRCSRGSTDVMAVYMRVCVCLCTIGFK